MAVHRPFGATESAATTINRRRSESMAREVRRAPTESAKRPMAMVWQPPPRLKTASADLDVSVWKKLTLVAAALFVATVIVAVAVTAL